MNKKAKSKPKQDSNGHHRRNGTSQPKSDNNSRTYSIPDMRLEHPDLSVRQAIEKDKDGTEHVR